MSGGVDPQALARLLRQRDEMGMGDLFLEELDRARALALAAGAEAGTMDASSSAPEEGAVTGRAPEGASAEGVAAEGAEAPDEPGDPDAAAATGAGTESAAGWEDAYEELRQTALGCTECPLSESRTQVVFSDGSPRARLMVVGEAPGAREDETGLPFVGPAGKLLDLLLATVGLSREESVYICNVLKCRPPGNRDPKPDEIATCSPYLLRQIELVSPEAILAVGSFSARLLTGKERALGKLRGEVYSYHGVPLVVTYHPAALLRNSGWTRPTWDDFQLIRQILDGG